jgi:HEAT repeat protein
MAAAQPGFAAVTRRSTTRRAIRSLPVLAAALGVTCAAPSDAMLTSDPCAELLQAPPHEWAARLPAAHALGPAAVPRLLALLQQDPAGPGAPAAVCLLGRLGGPEVVPTLRELVADRSPLAVEAALALGTLQDSGANDELRACVEDAAADATLRTAAACALVRCGDPRAATALLRAVVLAGSPAGAPLARTLGLPERPRWALERYLVQRLLAQEGAAELSLALDPDASWPALAAVAERITAWLEAR